MPKKNRRPKKKQLLTNILRGQIDRGENGYLTVNLEYDSFLKIGFSFEHNGYIYKFIEKTMDSVSKEMYYSCVFHKFKNLKYLVGEESELGRRRVVQQKVRIYWGLMTDISIKTFCDFQIKKNELEEFYISLISKENREEINIEVKAFNEDFGHLSKSKVGSPEYDDYIVMKDLCDNRVKELSNVDDILLTDEKASFKEAFIYGQMLDIMTGPKFQNFRDIPPSDVIDIVMACDFSVPYIAPEKMTSFFFRSKSKDFIKQIYLEIDGMEIKKELVIKEKEGTEKDMKKALKAVNRSLGVYNKRFKALKGKTESDAKVEIIDMLASLEASRSTMKGTYEPKIKGLSNDLESINKLISRRKSDLYSVENTEFVIDINYRSSVSMRQMQDQMVFMKDVRTVADTFKKHGEEEGSISKMALLLL